MIKIPMKFARIMPAAFDEFARKTRSPCQSSGSEHSAAADLSHLVNSFLEGEIGEPRITCEDDGGSNEINDDEPDHSAAPELELRNSLERVFDPENLDGIARSIRVEVEKALAEVSGDGNTSHDFKRRLMASLRDRGFDAGLCKSKWEKTGRHPSGKYEYIDVKAGGSRYIVEAFLAGAFTIARPTGGYASLLDAIPRVFVGKPEELKEVVRLMCRAMRMSMKSAELKLPPWRSLAYAQTKWFGPYKRVTSEIPSGKTTSSYVNDGKGIRSVGFAPAAVSNPVRCREDLAGKGRVGIGNLAVALSKELV